MSSTPPPLPETELWQPRKIARVPSVAEALLARYRNLEHEMAVRIEAEKESAFDFFDSGLPVEALVR